MISEVYEKNLDMLKKRYPQYAEYIENEKSEKNAEIEVIYDDKTKMLSVHANGNKYNLKSAYDNTQIVSRCLKILDEDWELNGKMLMYGLGNGMYVRYFLEHASKDHIIMVFEPSEVIFREVIKHSDITDILDDERFELYLNNAEKELSFEQFLDNRFDYTDLFTFKYKPYMNYNNIFVDEISIWKSSIEDLYGKIGGDHRFFGDNSETYFIENNYGNYKHYIESRMIGDLRNVVSDDIPAIVVSSGPSLSKNIHELKRAKGKAIIIGLDASVNPLIRAGIVPDIIVAVDPEKGEEYLAEETAKNVPLVCELNSQVTFMDAHKGLKFFALSYNSYTNEFLKDKPIDTLPLATGGSVANNAFSLAYILGCRKIILVGQDLAYTGDKTHAEGSVRGNEDGDYIAEHVETQVMDVDIYGNPIKTCVEYRRFRLWFEGQIRQLNDIEVIDATEGGAKIEGSTIITLKEAIDKYCTKEIDVAELINESRPMFTDKEKSEFIDYILDYENQINRVINRMNYLRGIYKKMKRMVRDGLTATAGMKSISTESNKILTEIQNDPAIQLAKDLATDEIDEIHKGIFKIEKDMNKEILAICKVGEEYLDILEKSAERTKILIAKYIDDIEKLKAEYEK